MNSIWSKNFCAFKNRFPQLARLFEENFSFLIKKYSSKNAEIPFWTLFRAKNNQISATENGVRLHSSYNPQKEAFNAVNAAEVQKKSATVFYGFGLGYHLIEWSKIYKNKKLTVIEPDVERFFAAMSLLDFSPVFEIEKLAFAVGCQSDAAIALLEDGKKINLGDEGVCDSFFFDIPIFTAHAKDYFEQIKTLVKRNQKKNAVNAATLKKFGKLWSRNSLKNVEQYSSKSGIGILKNKAREDLPFLIVGAGPSVQKILPFLEQIKNRCVIVCVETVLQAFLTRGIEPDFLILTDPQFWAFKHIAALSSKNAFLITEISVYPAVFDFDCKEILLCGSQFPIGKYFEQKCGLSENLGDLGTGGSVASCAWNFAEFCGAKEIFTIGLDFSFPQKQTHIKGSSQEQSFHAFSRKLNSAEKQTLKTIFSADVFYENSYGGQKVLTDSRMKMFAWWFESRISNCAETKTYSLSEESLKIPGVDFFPLQDFLKKREKVQEKNEFLSYVQKKDDLKSDFANKIVAEKIQKLKRNFPPADFLQEYPFLKPFL